MCGLITRPGFSITTSMGKVRLRLSTVLPTKPIAPVNWRSGNTSKLIRALSPGSTEPANRSGTPPVTLTRPTSTIRATAVPGATISPASTRRSSKIPEIGASSVVRSNRAFSVSSRAACNSA